MHADCALPNVPSPSLAFQEDSDVDLVHCILRGDRDAMRALFIRYNLRTFRFVLRLVRDGSLAEDVVNEVFLDVWRQAASFQERSQVSTWLLAIARNKAMTALRRRRMEPLDDRAAESIEDLTDNPEDVVDHGQRARAVSNCLMQLSAAHREIIDLVYYHQRSIEEAAEILGVRCNTVKSRMFYARRQMARLLMEAGVERRAAN